MCNSTKSQKLDFNPLSPCGERLTLARIVKAGPQFQSTLPVRGETGCEHRQLFRGYISIHSPRAGRDGWALCDGKRHMISIHSPRAGRDCNSLNHRRAIVISIHSPRAGRDTDGRQGWLIPKLFQSTLPVRGGTSPTKNSDFQSFISIHSPRAGRDFR